MAVRNLLVEQNALKTYTKQRGKLPSTPSEWDELHKMAYGSDLPDEFKSEVSNSYQEATGSPTSPSGTPLAPLVGNPLSQTQTGSQLDSLGARKESAYGRVVELGSGNEALRVLQEAIKAKTGVASAPIGESEIFKQAGVGGIGALGSSLASRGEEIKTNFVNFQNIISQMSGTYKDMASTALFAYQELDKDYDNEIARLQKIEDESRAYERQIELLQKQHQNAIELERVRASIPSISERAEGWRGGYTFDANGNPVADVSQASADDVADAIATVESGGRFGISGASGESGAFQFMPDTWNIISQQYADANGINMSLPMTQENEDKVARWKIGQLLAAGNTPEQVALIWNGSLGGSEKPTVKSGTNAKGVQYDTGAYASKVLNVLRQNAKQGVQTGEKLTPAQQQTALTSTVNQFDNEQVVKNYNVIAEGYQFAKSIGTKKNPTSADDQGLIYAFAKAMDPNSVVRESEYTTVQKYSQSMIQSGWANAKRMAKNVAFLTPEARKNMLETINSKYEASKKNYDNIKSEYNRRIDDIKKGVVSGSLTDYSQAWKGEQNMSSGTANDILSKYGVPVD